MTRYGKIAAAIGAFILLAMLGTQIWKHFHKPDFKPDIQKSERVEATHKVDAVLSVRTDTVVRTLVKTRTVLVHQADSTQHLAETLILVDTAKEYKLRWALALQTDTSLRKALHTVDSALTVMTVDRDRWHSEADSAVDVNRKLRTDLAKASQNQCRVVPFVPCPSRKVALGIGVGAGVVVGAGKLPAIARYLKGIRFVH